MSIAPAICAEHPDRAAQGVCARCGTFVCPACGYLVDGQIVCVPCSRRVDAGKAKHLPLLGILMIASGAGGTLLGLVSLVFASFIVFEMTSYLQQPGYPYDPYSGVPVDLDIITVAVLALFALGYCVAGAMQVIGGILARKRRARSFVLIALVVGLLSGAMNGVIGMLSVVLGVWGFTLLGDRNVQAAFARAKE